MGKKLLLRSKKKNFTKKMKSISLLLYFLPFPFFFFASSFLHSSIVYSLAIKLDLFFVQ